MNDAKKLTLDEIKNLPKGSVIWREEFAEDDDCGFVYYQLEPMLICVPGEDGVLAWANDSSYLFLSIGEDLLSRRSFWNKEPEPDMIEGVPESEYDKFIEETPLDDFRFQRKHLLSVITRMGFTVSRFCDEMDLDQSSFIKFLQDESREVILRK